MIKTLRHKGYTIYLDTPLGEGAFGKVYFCESDQDLDLYAAKIYHSMDQTVMAEMESLRKLSKKSEHVLSLKDFFKADGKWVLITEYCPKTLAEFVEDTGGKLNENLAQKFFVHLLKGLKAINDQGIIHRDIKLENLFVSNGKLKIGDFGFAVEKQVTRSIIGTPVNMPPELLNRLQMKEGDMYYDKNIDVWSCGIVLYQMLFGKHPFDITMTNDFVNDLKMLITAASKTDIVEQIDKEPVKISGDCKELLEKMFAVDKHKRYNFTTIWNSKWVIDGLIKFNKFEDNVKLKTVFESNMISSSSIKFKSEIKKHREASKALVKTYFNLHKFINNKNAEIDFLKMTALKFQNLIDEISKNMKSRPRLNRMLREDLKTAVLMRLLVQSLLLTMYQYLLRLFDNNQTLSEKIGADPALLAKILEDMTIEEINSFKNDLKINFATTKKYLTDIKANYQKAYPGVISYEVNQKLTSILNNGIYAELALFETVVKDFFSMAKKYLMATSMLDDDKFELELKWCFLLMHFYKSHNDKSDWENILTLLESFNDFDVNEYVRNKLGIEKLYDGIPRKPKRNTLFLAVLFLFIAYLFYRQFA